jgi:hypothetical protein
MSFLIRTPKDLMPVSTYAGALEIWRRTASVVEDLWAEYRAASRELQPLAFFAYVAALNEEEAAAEALRDLTRTPLRLAA